MQLFNLEIGIPATNFKTGSSLLLSQKVSTAALALSAYLSTWP